MSIIIACYKAGDALREAVESVYAVAPRVPFEILVVDDASPDAATQRALDEIGDGKPEVRVFRQSRNQGQSAARNVALDAAQYDFILPLDADDRLNPDKPGYIESAIGLMENDPDLLLTYCRGKFFGARTSPFLLPSYSEKRLLTGNMIPVFGIYRRDEALAVGGYQESLRYCEDWEMWLALHSRRLEKGDERIVTELPEAHYLYRQHTHGGNVSVAQKMPLADLFRQMIVRSRPLFEHHLETSDPESIAEIRRNKDGRLIRFFERVSHAGSPVGVAHYTAETLAMRCRRFLRDKMAVNDPCPAPPPQPEGSHAGPR